MSVSTHREFDGHEEVAFCSDAETGLKAIIAIHNTNLGPALGGCRMWPYVSEDAALTDVLRLSRGMTYKSALAGLDLGGGKAVIIGDARTAKCDALLRAYGRFVDSLGGRYITAEDVGTTVHDMDIVRGETPFAAGISDGCGNPSPATAYGVFMSIRAAVAHRLSRNDLSGVRVGVQGIGNVGYALCGYLADAGAVLYVGDIDPEACRRAADAFGATVVPPDDVLRLDVDVVSPCALGAVLNDDTVPRIQAGIVAGAANNQLAEDRHGRDLHNRGILYAPDYVANAGGVIDCAGEGPDYDCQAVLRQVATIYDTLTEVFRRSEAEGLPTNVVADHMAEERFRRR